MLTAKGHGALSSDAPTSSLTVKVWLFVLLQFVTRRSALANVLAILLIAFSAPLAKNAEAMTMSQNGEQAVLSGRIVATDSDQFTTFLESNPGIRTIILMNSPGGSMKAAYSMSALIQIRGLKTAVAGYCVSACGVVFLSGIERYFSDAEAIEFTTLGFHGAYGKNDKLEPEDHLKFLSDFIENATAGRADKHLVDGWTHLADRRVTVRFLYPGSDGAPKNVSVLLCVGSGPNRGNFRQCTPISGVNAFSMGIITSTERLHFNR